MRRICLQVPSLLAVRSQITTVSTVQVALKHSVYCHLKAEAAVFIYSLKTFSNQNTQVPGLEISHAFAWRYCVHIIWVVYFQISTDCETHAIKTFHTTSCCMSILQTFIVQRKINL